MSWLTALPALMTKLAGAELTRSILEKAVPGVLGVLENFALNQFGPKVPQAIRGLVAAATTFNPNLATWLQTFLNKQYAGKIAEILRAEGLYRDERDEKLAVDSVYGMRTTAMIKHLQRDMGMKTEWVDGWFGTLTRDWVLEKLGIASVPEVPKIVDPQTTAS